MAFLCMHRGGLGDETAERVTVTTLTGWGDPFGKACSSEYPMVTVACLVLLPLRDGDSGSSSLLRCSDGSALQDSAIPNYPLKFVGEAPANLCSQKRARVLEREEIAKRCLAVPDKECTRKGLGSNQDNLSKWGHPVLLANILERNACGIWIYCSLVAGCGHMRRPKRGRQPAPGILPLQ